jgi:hypothetical protein
MFGFLDLTLSFSFADKDMLLLGESSVTRVKPDMWYIK